MENIQYLVCSNLAICVLYNGPEDALFYVVSSYPHKRLWRPIGCEMLRIPHCVGNRITDGDEVVGLTRRSRSTPRRT
jgi:hypothetical protein